MAEAPAKPWLMLWRWHPLMGILCAPVLATLASTGLIYLYQPEIDAALHGIPRASAVGAPSTSSALGAPSASSAVSSETNTSSPAQQGSASDDHSANQALPSWRSALPASTSSAVSSESNPSSHAQQGSASDNHSANQTQPSWRSALPASASSAVSSEPNASSPVQQGSASDNHSANQALPSWRSALPAGSAFPASAAFPAASALPTGSTITEVLVHGGDRCLEIRLKRADGTAASAFVDPGNGAVVAVVADAERLTDWAIRIHRNLLIGTTGRLIAEFAAGWGLLLALSGLIWWWRTRRTLILASWHGWIGLAGAAPLLFLTLSALPWTEVWGAIHSRVVAALDGQNATPSWMHRPKSVSGLPSSMDYPGALLRAQALGLSPPFSIRAPSTANGTWRLSTPMGHPPETTRTVWLDAGDGRLVDERTPADRGRFAAPAAFGVSIHMGRYFGEVNRLLCALGCVAAVLLAITGSWLAARSGFAAIRHGGQPAPWWGVALVLVLLPLSAIPLVIDRLWPRRKSDSPTEPPTDRS